MGDCGASLAAEYARLSNVSPAASPSEQVIERLDHPGNRADGKRKRIDWSNVVVDEGDETP